MENDLKFKVFHKKLYDMRDLGLPVSESSLKSVAQAAVLAIHAYKDVVHHVEGFIRKSNKKYRLPAIQLITEIVRIEQKQHKGNLKFSTRFEKNLRETFKYVLECSTEDRKQVMATLKVWWKKRFFKQYLVGTLMERTKNLTAVSFSPLISPSSDESTAAKTVKQATRRTRDWVYDSNQELDLRRRRLPIASPESQRNQCKRPRLSKGDEDCSVIVIDDDETATK